MTADQWTADVQLLYLQVCHQCCEDFDAAKEKS